MNAAQNSRIRGSLVQKYSSATAATAASAASAAPNVSAPLR